MTRYRLRPMVHERDGEDLWAGALPHGPIVRLGGAAGPVLAVLAETGEPCAAAEVVARMREEVDGVPEDAEQVVAAFLRELADLGLVAEVSDDAPAGGPA